MLALAQLTRGHAVMWHQQMACTLKAPVLLKAYVEGNYPADPPPPPSPSFTGQHFSGSDLTFAYASPTISAISPLGGHRSGGTMVTVSGAGFIALGSVSQPL